MRSVWIHGVLLLLALAAAYATWTREEGTDTARERVTVWRAEPGDVASVTYVADRRTVRVERRTEGGDSFLWGTEYRTVRRAPVAPDDDDRAGIEPPGTGEAGSDRTERTVERVDTTEFPVGREGEALLELLAPLRALRELRDPSDEALERYGLADPGERIRVELPEGTRELEVGAGVYGSGDRYAAEPGGDRVYVLPAEIFRKLGGGEGALRERELHAFRMGDVGRVRVRTPSGERTMLHTGGDVPSRATWAPPEAPDRPDPSFANFMERLERLWISRYEPRLSPDSLELVLRVEYFGPGDGAEPLGFLELHRRPASAREGDEGVRYYLRTERTRVPASTDRRLAEQVDQDTGQLF